MAGTICSVWQMDYLLLSLDADWYRYLWIFKGVGSADFAIFWQDDQGLTSIKFSSKSLDIKILSESWLFSINHHLQKSLFY